MTREALLEDVWLKANSKMATSVPSLTLVTLQAWPSKLWGRGLACCGWITWEVFRIYCQFSKDRDWFRPTGDPSIRPHQVFQCTCVPVYIVGAHTKSNVTKDDGSSQDTIRHCPRVGEITIFRLIVSRSTKSASSSMLRPKVILPLYWIWMVGDNSRERLAKASGISISVSILSWKFGIGLGHLCE